MGNSISLSNVTEQTFPNNVQYALIGYRDEEGNDVPFQPNRKYYFRYAVTHTASGQTIEKIYPTPFYTKPLLGVLFLHMSVVFTDEFTLKVRITDLQYTDEMYRNTILPCEVYAEVWDTEFENDGFHPVLNNVQQDFDNNNETLLQSTRFQQGEFVTIRVRLKNPTDNTEIYYERLTPNRLFIPFVPLPTNIVLYDSASRPDGGIL